MTKKAKAKKTKQELLPPVEPKQTPKNITEIPYAEAVRRGRKLVHDLGGAIDRLKNIQWELAEVTDRCEKKYGDGTLKKLAEEWGLKPNTVQEYRRVYRAFPSLQAFIGDENPGRPGNSKLPAFSVAAALVKEPDREALVKSGGEGGKPLTQKEARALVKERDAADPSRKAKPAAPPKEEEAPKEPPKPEAKEILHEIKSLVNNMLKPNEYEWKLIRSLTAPGVVGLTADMRKDAAKVLSSLIDRAKTLVTGLEKSEK